MTLARLSVIATEQEPGRASHVARVTGIGIAREVEGMPCGSLVYSIAKDGVNPERRQIG